MTDSRLYYEAHVTVNARGDEHWDTFKIVAATCGWRASKFSEDEVDDYHGKWFLSYRDVHLETTKSAVRAMIAALESGEFEVIRWKVEDTVLDSKHGDTLEVEDA